MAPTLKDQARKARRNLRDMLAGGRFTCACCPGKEFRGHRALNAHHLARHGSYWAGDKAKKTGRKIGKAADAARRHARAWREAAGLADRDGNRTHASRSRPELSGRLRLRDLRRAHRHDRDHRKAAVRDQKADRARSGGSRYRADSHQARADSLRARHGTPSRGEQERQARERLERLAAPRGPRANSHLNGRGPRATAGRTR